MPDLNFQVLLWSRWQWTGLSLVRTSTTCETRSQQRPMKTSANCLSAYSLNKKNYWLRQTRSAMRINLGDVESFVAPA